MFNRLFVWNDRRRARDVLQQFCEDRVTAIRFLDHALRHADLALIEAQKVEAERFRMEFFGRRDPVHAAFVEGSANLFGIREPTSVVIEVKPLAAIEPRRLKVAA